MVDSNKQSKDEVSVKAQRDTMHQLPVLSSEKAAVCKGDRNTSGVGDSMVVCTDAVEVSQDVVMISSHYHRAWGARMGGSNRHRSSYVAI